jgi:hypothetical protein
MNSGDTASDLKTVSGNYSLSALSLHSYGSGLVPIYTGGGSRQVTFYRVTKLGGFGRCESGVVRISPELCFVGLWEQ